MKARILCRTLKNGKIRSTGFQLIWIFAPGLVHANQFAQLVSMKLLTEKFQQKILANVLHVVLAKPCVRITQFYAIGHTHRFPFKNRTIFGSS